MLVIIVIYIIEKSDESSSQDNFLFGLDDCKGPFDIQIFVENGKGPFGEFVVEHVLDHLRLDVVVSSALLFTPIELLKHPFLLGFTFSLRILRTCLAVFVLWFHFILLEF